MLRPLFFALCVCASFASSAYALDCDPDSPLVMDAECLLEEESAAPGCGGIESEAQSELERVYEYLWTRAYYQEKTALENSQGAWLQYRQAACELDALLHEECVERLTTERTALLRSLGGARYLYLP